MVCGMAGWAGTRLVTACESDVEFVDVGAGGVGTGAAGADSVTSVAFFLGGAARAPRAAGFPAFLS